MKMTDFTACVVLPAAGTGSRMGMEQPKQFCSIAGKPLICYTIESFSRIPWVTHVIVTVSPERKDLMLQLIETFDLVKVSLAEGGSARHRSIYSGVKQISTVSRELPDVVVIHDAVRPFTSEQTVREVAEAAIKCGAAGITRPLVSTVISTTSQGFLDESLDRSKYRNSEMPQAFKHEIIETAYEKCTDHDLDHGTECLHLAQKYAGATVRLLDGTEDLWKVTTKKDIYAAEGMVKENENKVVVVGCKDDLKKRALSSGLHEQFLKVRFDTSLKSESSIKANHIVIFLNDEKEPNGAAENGDSERKTDDEADIFPDINVCCNLKTLTYVLWNPPEGSSGEHEYDDFKSLIKAHHLLGKVHNICTYGMYVEESLLIEENEFQSNVFSLVADVIFHRNNKLSGQVFEM